MTQPRSETEIGGNQRTFEPTAWTSILKAKDRSSPDRQQALDALIVAYWKPVYFFVRRRGNDVERAKDLTQAFFTTFIEKDFLKDVSPEKGKFRTFVLSSLVHFLANQIDHDLAKKRGGGFNFVEAETELVGADSSPDKAFFNQWALEVMSRGMEQLRKEIGDPDFSLLAGARPSGMPDHERKNRLHRLRLRLRQILREIILPSVEDEESADAELQELLFVSSRRV